MSDWQESLIAAADSVTMLLAGPPQRTDLWMTSLSADTRFRVSTIASTPEDLRMKAATRPDAILIDAAIFSSGEHCVGEVARIQDSKVFVVLPQIPPKEAKAVETQLLALPAVSHVYHVDMNMASAMEAIFAEARAAAVSRAGGSAWGAGSGGNGGTTPVSTRIISIWNQMGGVGKTTVSSNLAVEAARRGYPTLLVDLGAPDDLPLIMGLKAQPNITHWQANPTVEGLKLAVQKVGTLDVLGGFPDVLSEAQAINMPSDHPGSVKSLINTAISAGYAVVIIDAPPTSLAAAALLVSNTLVIVGRPSLEGVYRTVEAYRTITERLHGMHNIPTGKVYCVLNRLQNGKRLDADTWHRMASESMGRPFPPVMAQIPDLPSVGEAQDNRRIPIVSDDTLAAAIKPLADTLFAAPGQQKAVSGNGKVLKLGPIKVRV